MIHTFAWMALLPAGAIADVPIYKCVDATGRVLYTDAGCANPSRLDIQPGEASPAAIRKLEREVAAAARRHAARQEAERLEAAREAAARRRIREHEAAERAARAAAEAATPYTYYWLPGWPTWHDWPRDHARLPKHDTPPPARLPARTIPAGNTGPLGGTGAIPLR